MSFRLITRFDQAIKSAQRFIMILTSAIIVLIVGLAALLRYLFSTDLYGAEEFLTIAAFWMYFTSAVYATHTRSHISAEVFSTFCRNAAIRRGVNIFQQCVTVALALLYSYWGWNFFYWSLTEGGKSTVWQIPLVVSHAAVSLGLVLIAWYFVLQLIGDIRDLARKKIRIAGQYAPDHPATQALHTLRQRIESGSKGKINLQVCADSELGDYTQVYEGLSQGRISMALISVPSQLDQQLGAMYLPYLATDYRQAQKLYARGSILFREAERLHREQAIKFLGFNMEGFGGLAFQAAPDSLGDPTTAKRVSVRVPPMDVFKVFIEDQGFEPVTVPFNQVANVMEAEGIEGIAGCPPMAAFHFRALFSHYLVNRHFIETTSYLMSESLWNSLDDKQQMMIQAVVDELSNLSFETAGQVETEYLDRLQEAGGQVITLSPAELAARVKATRLSTWPRLYPRLSPAVVQWLQELAGASVSSTLSTNDTYGSPDAADHTVRISS